MPARSREWISLFTGDTYYPGPIWLYRPETDLDAYVALLQKIAALAPDLKLVLGAHNSPIAQPSVLPLLVRGDRSGARREVAKPSSRE